MRYLILQQHTPRVLDILLDLDQELYSFSSVEEAVIVRKGKIHHRTDFDFAIDSHGTFLDRMKSEHSCLWQVDNRSSHKGAEDTTVADGECAASHVLNR